MNKYIIFNEFGKRKFTNYINFMAYIRDAAQVIDASGFASDEDAKQYFINNWNLLECQIEIIR